MYDCRMATKIVCDGCESELSNEVRFVEVRSKDIHRDLRIRQADLCRACFGKVIVAMFASLPNKKSDISRSFAELLPPGDWPKE